MRVAQKVSIITGGARGIGRAAVELFASEGAIVYAVDLSFEEPFESESVRSVHMDVTSPEQWDGLVANVLSEQQRIDILFNNAGAVGSYDGIADISFDDWHRIIDLNLNGVFYGTKAVLPAMREAGYGAMVHTSSMWGYVGASGVAAYTASKRP